MRPEGIMGYIRGHYCEWCKHNYNNIRTTLPTWLNTPANLITTVVNDREECLETRVIVHRLDKW